MREYERFEKGAANRTCRRSVLKRQLEDPDARIIIITTIQKLSRFVDQNKGHAIYDGHVVLDLRRVPSQPVRRHAPRDREGVQAVPPLRLHRHAYLRRRTPGPLAIPWLRTTEQAFGDRLHTYTIVDAINDRNVLPFRLDYVNTIKLPAHLADKQVSAIDTERALLAPERIGQVVGYIREHFDQKTKRSFAYTLAGKRLAGFNSLLATASIDAAKRYYAEFARQQAELPEAQRLKVGLIYSYAVNEDDPDFLADEEFETDDLDASSRDFLEGAISDYNAMFGTSFDTSSDRFQNYYKDRSSDSGTANSTSRSSSTCS